MTGRQKLDPHDPTAQRTADQSTQSAGGLHQRVAGGTGDGAPDGALQTDTEDVLNRNDEDLYETPRRYDEEDRDAKHGSHG
jgi:hypothetical protein